MLFVVHPLAAWNKAEGLGEEMISLRPRLREVAG